MAAGGKGSPGQLLGSRTFVFAWQVSMQQMIKKRGKLEQVFVGGTNSLELYTTYEVYIEYFEGDI